MIKANHLVKRYGELIAVNGIEFSVGTGEVVGFLGPNGAGKSTTMKMLTSFIEPSAGTATIGGYDVIEQPEEVKRLIGYLPENNPVYGDLCVYDYLVFMGGLKGLKGEHLQKAIRTAAGMCDVASVMGRRIDTLSKGFQQRVGLAQAILAQPPILILDEPTTGLDPNQIAEIRKLIRELGKEKTVILSTHIMQEVEQTCDRAIIISEGQIVADAPLDELTGAGNIYTLETDPMVKPADLELFGTVRTNDDGTITIMSEEDVRREIAAYCCQHGMLVLEFSRKRESLEDIFRKLTGRKNGGVE